MFVSFQKWKPASPAGWLSHRPGCETVQGVCELKVVMEGRGGIGLGLAEPELSVQYVVAGGAASDHAGFFEVRREEE